MIAHARGCVRGDWLLTRPKLGLFWAVLFQEGPPCDCSAAAALFSAEHSPPVTEGAQEAPTGVNSEAGGASPT